MVTIAEQHAACAANVRIDINKRFRDFHTVQAALDYVAACKNQSRRNSKTKRKSGAASLPGAGGLDGEDADPLLFSYAEVWTACLSLQGCAAQLAAYSCRDRLHLTMDQISAFSLSPGKQGQLLKLLQAFRADYERWMEEHGVDPLGLLSGEAVYTLPLGSDFATTQTHIASQVAQLPEQPLPSLPSLESEFESTSTQAAQLPESSGGSLDESDGSNSTYTTGEPRMRAADFF